jgi:hypothetical protein
VWEEQILHIATSTSLPYFLVIKIACLPETNISKWIKNVILQTDIASS